MARSQGVQGFCINSSVQQWKMLWTIFYHPDIRSACQDYFLSIKIQVYFHQPKAVKVEGKEAKHLTSFHHKKHKNDDDTGLNKSSMGY